MTFESVCHDRQNSPSSGSSYHLADDRHDVEAPQGWDAFWHFLKICEELTGRPLNWSYVDDNLVGDHIHFERLPTVQKGVANQGNAPFGFRNCKVFDVRTPTIGPITSGGITQFAGQQSSSPHGSLARDRSSDSRDAQTGSLSKLIALVSTR